MRASQTCAPPPRAFLLAVLSEAGALLCWLQRLKAPCEWETEQTLHVAGQLEQRGTDIQAGWLELPTLCLLGP